jgi:carboxypeptidase-like protein
MSAIRTISIPEPCRQSWQNMHEAGNGRHCDHCCKTVIDFTTMTNDQIIAHLSASKHVCGRLGEQQLAGINHHLYAENLPKASWWKRVVIFVGMLTPITSRVAAQSREPIVKTADSAKTQKLNYTISKIVAPNPAAPHYIKGKVTGEDDKLPIPGATIKIKGTATGTMTDAAGNYTIFVQPGNVLEVTFVGYVTQQLPITIAKKDTLNIVMQTSGMLLGEVVIVRVKPNVKKAWRRVKERFGGAHSELAVDSNNMRSPYF